MQCQKRLQTSRVKNIDNVLEKSGVAFRLAPPYGWFLVLQSYYHLLASKLIVIVWRQLEHKTVVAPKRWSREKKVFRVPCQATRELPFSAIAGKI